MCTRVESAVVHGGIHSRAINSRIESSRSLDRLCLTHTVSKNRSGESSSISMGFYFEFSGTLNLKRRIRDYNTFPSVFHPFTRFVRSQVARCNPFTMHRMTIISIPRKTKDTSRQLLATAEHRPYVSDTHGAGNIDAEYPRII